jgi:hypothetical protein
MAAVGMMLMPVGPANQQWLTVEFEQTFPDLNTAKTDIAGFMVGCVAGGINQTQNQSVKVGRLGRPESGLIHGYLQINAAAKAAPFIDFTPTGHGQLNISDRCITIIQTGIDAGLGIRDLGAHMQNSVPVAGVKFGADADICNSTMGFAQ